MKMIIIIIVLVIVISLITDSSAAGRKGKDKILRHKSGKSMLDDFDKERKDLDNLMK
ncbi:MAG: hypothetical protein KH828_09090 [Clostridiales bacterium]|nr:hypothetical protein [Clostridiales bacterium]